MDRYLVKAVAMIDYEIFVDADNKEQALEKAKSGDYPLFDIHEIGQESFDIIDAELIEN